MEAIRYKGKGEHSVNELELIIEQKMEELHLINSGQKQLRIGGVSDSFICVKDQEPPKNTELIAQDPRGGNYLTSWREAYKIFTCQNKQENSSEWKWKQI